SLPTFSGGVWLPPHADNAERAVEVQRAELRVTEPVDAHGSCASPCSPIATTKAPIWRKTTLTSWLQWRATPITVPTSPFLARQPPQAFSPPVRLASAFGQTRQSVVLIDG